ncbi:hypothetical protein L2Y94_05495 [Luteibacter aegosomatis]|uniref:hypothetical protein n=1 Tax=Luteibacter aegosomatis TaxID=2911537 RepID=UPI001FFA6A93|nr:hypothetical protein [Luteibacter aegosomatis]UPG86809.1 hypothetical protein L2Y94_05495 [Luteibacter aegosomatis]
MIRILQRLAARVMRRQPDFVIGGADAPYLLRWWVIPRNPFFNVYVHRFLRSDDDRALHDHPWANVSVLLAGQYIEHRIRAGGVHTATLRQAGTIAARMPKSAHRIELLADQACTTLFITGPRMRNWGFHCRRGWVPWQKFTAANDRGAIGAGCEALTEESKA